MKKQCPVDQSQFVSEMLAGELGIVAGMRLRLHHLACPSCRTEWNANVEMLLSLRGVATAEPPPLLRRRIWSQIPEMVNIETDCITARHRAQRLRWVTAGIATATLLTAGSVTAQMVMDPLRKQYAVMHEDANLSSPLHAADGSSGITSRLDGLYGHDGSQGMRWRVTGRVTVKVFATPSGHLLGGGETSVLDREQTENLRVLLGPKTYSHLLGLNPIADPDTPPVLTVNENGRVERTIGYGTFTVFEKWRFEITPLTPKP